MIGLEIKQVIVNISVVWYGLSSPQFVGLVSQDYFYSQMF